MNAHLFKTTKGLLLPNAFRWFVGQNLVSFEPWHFCSQLDEFTFATQRFQLENPAKRELITILRRHDRDDFAGFEIKDNQICENVIYYHPSFHNTQWNIICGEYKNLFAFVQKVVLPDMEEWTSTENAEEYFND
ncbi:hypothetical protein QNI16_24815 [Cytophagaceae bacterium YF14B1]|uniref:Uncharacterized protein n=1 Tax=Xanthocytophaga flava TaxID=3048013 RepID=A0AAE3QUY5_9BACT|nr:hypothetical protein [Xanthocytophaga flavus]MDJ1483745.1 hypothetical protein [Xanthocytophaga flavus]